MQERALRFGHESPWKARGHDCPREQPFNAESGLAALAETLTATDSFCVRGHGDVPDIDAGTWRLRVRGAVKRDLGLSLTTLRECRRRSKIEHFRR